MLVVIRYESGGKKQTLTVGGGPDQTQPIAVTQSLCTAVNSTPIFIPDVMQISPYTGATRSWLHPTPSQACAGNMAYQHH